MFSKYLTVGVSNSRLFIKIKNRNVFYDEENRIRMQPGSWRHLHIQLGPNRIEVFSKNRLVRAIPCKFSVQKLNKRKLFFFFDMQGRVCEFRVWVEPRGLGEISESSCRPLQCVFDRAKKIVIQIVNRGADKRYHTQKQPSQKKGSNRVSNLL